MDDATITQCRSGAPMAPLLWLPAALAVLLVGLGSPEAAAAAPVTYEAGSGSAVTYYVDHPLHDVVGTSHAIEGTVQWDPARPAAPAPAEGDHFQAPWQSFDSGNANRDENVLEFVQAHKYPKITFLIEALEVTAATAPATAPVPPSRATVHGFLYVNGHKHPVTSTAELNLQDPQRLTVRMPMAAKLTDFGIEPPSVMFVEAENAFRMEVYLVLMPRKD